ncbi:MAG: YceI family protein [Gordonia sp. (in: high G+C Gram-positive bacteria)]|uniref:YceI family protein n=1 Tax=Gordonia sp. (in: high G+C Gram-positive bacteria) TaxID=84139 RepID=UPI003C78471C
MSSPSQILLGPEQGTFTLRTGVVGPAARTGHNLTIEFERWQATVDLDGNVPTAVVLAVNVESLQVRSGEGGITPMTPPERALARVNALKSLKVTRFGDITFRASAITATDDGYSLTGDLSICGKTRPHSVTVVVDGTQVSGESSLKQTDFGVKQYSLMMGALKVADEVTVALEATIPT